MPNMMAALVAALSVSQANGLGAPAPGMMLQFVQSRPGGGVKAGTLRLGGLRIEVFRSVLSTVGCRSVSSRPMFAATTDARGLVRIPGVRMIVGNCYMFSIEGPDVPKAWNFLIYRSDARPVVIGECTKSAGCGP